MFNLQKAITVSGIAAFISLIVTGYLGAKGTNIEAHEKAAMTTFALVLVHVGSVIYKQVKVRRAKRQAGR
jgi:uncharacterized membrane protein YozB (DUF420 family)